MWDFVVQPHPSQRPGCTSVHLLSGQLDTLSLTSKPCAQHRLCSDAGHGGLWSLEAMASFLGFLVLVHDRGHDWCPL